MSLKNDSVKNYFKGITLKSRYKIKENQKGYEEWIL